MRIIIFKTVKCWFKLNKQALKFQNNYSNITSIGKLNDGGAVNGHEFELRTITEKSTKTNILKQVILLIDHTDIS